MLKAAATMPKASSSTKCTGDRLLSPEQEAAKSCRAYADEVLRQQDTQEVRDRLTATLEDLYVRRLQLPNAKGRVDEFRARLTNPKTLLIEIAHDGQIPHLGIVRLVLKARQIAENDGQSIAVYLVGDHYSPEMRPANLNLGLPLRGVDADHVKSPLIVPVGRRARHVPFRWLPPPTDECLRTLEHRAETWIVHNTSGGNLKRRAPEILEKLRREFEMMHESSVLTSSFGDWLMRIQVIWLDRMFGGRATNIIILPMTGVVQWVPEAIRHLATNEATLEKVKALVSANQRAASETPYSPAKIASSFAWAYCPACRSRNRARWHEDGFNGVCSRCQQPLDLRWPADSEMLMPDIVGFEMALFRAGFAGWVAGSHAPYHPVIERAYREVFGIDMPPKFFLTSVPRFLGIGEPAEGHRRARLPRVLLEVEPGELRKELETPWTDNPEVCSAYLSVAKG